MNVNQIINYNTTILINLLHPFPFGGNMAEELFSEEFYKR